MTHQFSTQNATNFFPYPRMEELTRSEYEVLKLMADGYSNREIAEQLSKSVETVKCQLKSIYSKLCIRVGQPGSKRVHAAQTAKEIGLL